MNKRNTNTYEIHGNTATLIVNSPKHGPVRTTVDASQVRALSLFTWCAIWHPRRKVFNFRAHLTGRKNLALHHLIAGRPKPGQCVDHYDGDTQNNTSANLRIITNQENQHNRRLVRGYTFHKKTGKWQASIRVDGKLIHLGLYATEMGARFAYVNAKTKYHPSAPQLPYELPRVSA